MYDLYVAGNGTRNKNLQDITDLDGTIVSKNGEIIDGHRDEKILRTVLEGVVDSLDFSRLTCIINLQVNPTLRELGN